MWCVFVFHILDLLESGSASAVVDDVAKTLALALPRVADLQR